MTRSGRVGEPEVSSSGTKGGRIDEWRRGWPVVVSGALGYGTGIALFNVCAGLFVRPMQADLGWSAKALSIAPLAGLVMAVCNPFLGALVDRWGARRAMIAGLGLFACALLALALAPAEPAAVYGCVILLGAVAPLTSAAPVARGVASWFRTNTGAAIGVTMSGVSLVSLAAVPLVSLTIAQFGWRAGYLTLMALILLVGLPAITLLFREPVALPTAHVSGIPQTGCTISEVLRDRRFWGLLMALMAAALPLGGYLVHLQPILAGKGFSLDQATLLVMTFALGISIGRVGGGVLLDRLWDGLVAAVLLILAAAGSLLLSRTGVDAPFALTVTAVALLGMAQGAEADFLAFFSLKLFGLRSYSTVIGIYAMAVGLTMSVGGFGFAALFDQHGDYAVGMAAASLCFLLASALMLLTSLLSRASATRRAS